MSAVELVAAGLKAPTGTSSAVDVSAHSMLRLSVDVRGTDMGRQPTARVWLESSRDGVNGWRVLEELQFLHFQSSADSFPFGDRRVVLSDFDEFVRVRWWAKAGANSADGNPALMLSVAGTGIPDA